MKFSEDEPSNEQERQDGQETLGNWIVGAAGPGEHPKNEPDSEVSDQDEPKPSCHRLPLENGNAF